jgi:hypothetical protein
MRVLAFYLALNSLFTTHVLAKNFTRNKLERREEIEHELILKNANFTLKNYAIEHQGKNILDIEVRYAYKTSTTSSTLQENTNLSRQLQELLENYPNETDFWEVINSNLTKQLLKQNKEIASVSIALAVHPNQKLPYDRASIVTRQKDNQIWESWHFDVRSNVVEKTNKRFAKINVEYRYKSNSLDYPDFLPIYKQIEQFILDRTRQNDSWESIDRQLTTMILKKNPKISYLSIELIK